MVGYNDASEYHLSEFWQGIAGTCSGILTRFTCQPLDVLKIRFQLQHEPLTRSSENYYWSIKQACLRILKEESYRGLWKGHVPAQILSATYGLAQFSAFGTLTKLTSTKLGPDYNKTLVHFICGSVSGGIATIVSMPFDTLRTRLVGQGEPKIYNGVTQAFVRMIRVEGFLSLYKGVIPNVIQILPHTGIQFAVFNFLTDIYHKSIRMNNSEKLPVIGNLICGSAAGLVAKVAVYPFDLAKKRLQVQGFEVARSKFGKVRTYNGMVDCLKSTLIAEGFVGLYKGIVPSSVKAMVTTGLIFTFYEEISHLFIWFRL